MSDDNQLTVPPSFTALHADRMGRLRTPAAEIYARYELSEDLACGLVEQAQLLYHHNAPSEDGVLLGIHAGLCEAALLSHAEACWVVQRLAELLEWRCPDLTKPEGDEAPQPPQPRSP